MEIEGAERARYYPAVVSPGDAILWEGRTWHGGGEHRSDKTRYVITGGFSLAEVTPQHQYTACLHDDVYDTLTQEELEVLGFSTMGAGYTNRIAPRRAGDARTNTDRKTPFIPELHREDA